VRALAADARRYAASPLVSSNMQNPISNQIILLLLGFILTTVIGGLLGSYFQNRNWKHQNQIKLIEAERATATKVFESLSSLMDRRVYRMMQLNWKIRDDSIDGEMLEKYMEKYRDVLYEWNDNLNKNLALTQGYFGTNIRAKLEGTIYEKFSAIGRELEEGYRERTQSGNASEFKKTKLGLTSLRGNIYSLNVEMIRLIQRGNVGVFNPDTKSEE
jgi:hypothetical protein